MPFHELDQAQDFGTVLAAWSQNIAASLNTALCDGVTAVPVSQSRSAVAATGSTSIPPHAVVPARFADHCGVDVVTPTGSPLAAVMFVGADHKADSDGALVFAVRVAATLMSGAGVVVVDIAPGPATWAMHLNTLVPVYPTARRPRGVGANVLVVQPFTRDGTEQYAVWYHTVQSGEAFPSVHLPLRDDTRPALDLEATHPGAAESRG